MSFYPPKIAELFNRPRNAGTCISQGSKGKAVSFVCGTFIEVSVSIDDETKSISRAVYRTNGCGYLIAAAESLSRDLEGQELKSLHGMNDGRVSDILDKGLGPLPEGRAHCAMLAADAVRLALAEYRRSVIEEFKGEVPLICTCFGVTEETVRRIIIENLPKDADDISAHTNAGTGCGSCRMLIDEMIEGLSDVRD